MKFKDKNTGAVLEPSDEVAKMMLANPNLEKLEDKPKAAPRKRTAAKKAE
jgi:hypothetical protein